MKSLRMNLRQIKDFYDKGEYQALLEYLAETIDQSQFSSLAASAQIEYLYYKSRALDQLGQYEEAFAVASQFRHDIAELQNTSAILALLISQLYPLVEMGQLNEALAIVNEGNTIIDSLTETERTDRMKWIAAFLDAKSLLYEKKGDSALALEFAQQSLSLRETIGDPNEIAETLRRIATSYWHKGESEPALKQLQRALPLVEPIGNLRETARILNNLGLIYHDKGELNAALDHYQQSLALQESAEHSLGISIALANIGRLHSDRGELELALKYTERTLALRESLGNPIRIATALSSMARIHLQKGELELAKDYLQRSLAMSEAAGSDLYKVRRLLLLLLVALAQKNRPEAQLYLFQLEKVHLQSPTKYSFQNYRLAKALFLKDSTRLIDKADAQKLLMNIVDEEPFPLAMIHLCELLLDELKAFGDPEVLQEAKGLAERLYALAQKEHSFSLVIEALIMQAKFSVVEGDLVASIDLLDQARMTAEEKDLGLLTEKAAFEKNHLEEQYENWSSFIDDSASLQERLEETKLREYLRDIKKLSYF